MPNGLMRKLTRFFSPFLITLSATVACWAAPLKCDLSEYKARSGLSAALKGEVLVVDWTGLDSSEIRAGFAVDNGVPTIRDLAVRVGGAWTTLGEHLTPEFRVMRRVAQPSVPVSIWNFKKVGAPR